MFKKIIICLSYLTFSGLSFSQPLMWVEQNSGTTQTLTSVHSVSGDIVWVCGYGGTVLRSTNLGSTWTNVSGNGIPPNTQLINIVSWGSGDVALTAGYVGANTFVYRTSNAGASWTQIFTEANGFINGICLKVSDPNTGFMMGDPVGGRWSLWKTANSGMNWDSSGLYLPQTGAEAGWVNSIFSIDNRLWFGTNNSRVYYSANFGSNWITQPTTGELNSYAVWFCGFQGIDGYTGFIGGTTLQKTTNSGTNWLSQLSTGVGNFGGISGGPNIIFDNNMGYLNRFYVRSDNKIYASTNNGTNWTADYTASAGTYRYVASDFNGLHFWAVRTNGGISYLDLPVSVTNTGNEIPAEYSLSQNYPNPFNPSTMIMFDIPKSNPVKLAVFDIAGKEVKIILNEFKPAGSYSVTFDGSSLTNGIYFYKLEVNDFSISSGKGFVSTKKMILIK